MHSLIDLHRDLESRSRPKFDDEGRGAVAVVPCVKFDFGNDSRVGEGDGCVEAEQKNKNSFIFVFFTSKYFIKLGSSSRTDGRALASNNKVFGFKNLFDSY